MMVIYIILGTALIISFITDIKDRKILNIVTLPTILFGLIYHTVTKGWDGFVFSSLGFLVGFGLLLIPFILGGMGAGDVKLMGAIGALMGASFTLNAFILIALIGGVISLFLILKHNGAFHSFKNFIYIIPVLKISGAFSLKNKNRKKILLPYGVPIVLGTFCSFFWGGII